MYYENQMKRQYCLDPLQAGPSQSKRILHCKTLLLCVWWDSGGVIKDCGKIQKLCKEIDKKHILVGKRDLEIILLHDNAKPHVVKDDTRQIIDNLGWEVLSHPTYSPDLLPNFLGLKDLKNAEVQKAVNGYFESEEKELYWCGIHDLSDRWQNVSSKRKLYIYIYIHWWPK